MGVQPVLAPQAVHALELGKGACDDDEAAASRLPRDQQIVTADRLATFIGTSAFTNVTGQLRLDTSDPAKSIVIGDFNGDGAADFQVELTGSIPLVSTDFVL